MKFTGSTKGQRKIVNYKAFKPKREKHNHIVKPSLLLLKGACLLGLAFVHTRPNSALKLLFHSLRLIGPLSNITIFLVVHITQHAVMQISLKMELPKLVLASITMSRGGRLRFQLIEMVFQYA
jgi:hypothetical protein